MGPQTAPALLDELLAAERHELAVRATTAANADRVTGFSTHVNLDVPDERVVDIARDFARHCGLAAALVGEPASSVGLLVRPRRGRLEICGEYAEGPHLVSLVTFVGSAVVALLNGSAPPQTPEPVVVPSREKFGWFLSPEGVYADLVSRPRPDGLDLLAEIWDWARPWCVRDGLDPTELDRLVENGSLRCEDRETPADACSLRPPARKPSASGLATGPRGRPSGVEGETAWLTWQHVAWRFTHGRRQVFAVLPVEEEQRFLDRLDAGEYDDRLARELARRWGRRTLLVHAQVGDSLWWHDLRPGALVPAERDAEGKVPRVSRRQAARAHRGAETAR